MMENGTPVIIEDSSDGEKLQHHENLLPEGELSDNSNTSSSSQSVTDSVSLDSEDVKIPESSVITIDEDITPHEPEEIPKSVRKVNGEVQRHKVHKECDTDSESDTNQFDKTNDAKTLCEKESESNKTNSEHDDILEEEFKSGEKFQKVGYVSIKKWCEDTEGDRSLYSDKDELQENLPTSECEVSKELCTKETKSTDLEYNSIAEEEVKNKELKCVKNVLNDDGLVLSEKAICGKVLDSNEFVPENKTGGDEKGSEPDMKDVEIDSESDKLVHSKGSESSKTLKLKETESEKKQKDDDVEYDTKVGDNDSDSAKKINDVETEKTALTIADGIKTRARNSRETKLPSSGNLQVLSTSRKRKRKASPICKDLSRKDSAAVDCNFEFKGFKKRLLTHAPPAANNPPITTIAGNNFPSSRELERIATPPSSLAYGADSSTRLTEYAQYLGLQPTVKFKCFKCGESGFPSMPALHEHQIVCLKTVKSQSISKYVVASAQPPTTTTTTMSSGTPSTNFRITRKVYLCSACGTYYENWNLFEHMRVVHKRLICLFCLGMFAQADKLSAHLCNIHRITEEIFQSAEHFMNEFKGSSFLMCCSCEKLFEETNNFFDHHCGQPSKSELCESCGVHGTCHLTGCKQKTVVNKTLQPVCTAPSDSVVTQTTVNSIKEPKEPSTTSNKYLVPSKKKAISSKEYKHAVLLETGSQKNKTQEKEFSDDDYDISDAASFCHVNIHEQPENQNDDDTRMKIVSPTFEANNGKPTTLTNTASHGDSDTESVKSLKNVADVDLPKPNEDNRKCGFDKEDTSSDSSGSCEFTEQKHSEKNLQKTTGVTTDVMINESQEQPILDTQLPENTNSELFTDNIEEQNEVGSSSVCNIPESEDSLYSLKVESIYEPPNSADISSASVMTEKADENGNDGRVSPNVKLTNTENNSIDSQTEHASMDADSDQKASLLFQEETPSDENSSTLPEDRLNTHLVETNSNRTDEPIKSSHLVSDDGQDGENNTCASDTQVKYNSSGSDNDTTQGSIAASSSSTDVSSDESQNQTDFQKNDDKSRSQIDSEDENIDSDKMSLVVDENGSDDEIGFREDNENNVDKVASEDKVLNVENIKQDTESDFESKQGSVADAQEVVSKEEMKLEESQDVMHVAENDAPLLELTLDKNIDEISCTELIKECVKVSSSLCVYCNHAKKIAVNGKQLLLHVLAEHRFSVVVCSDSGELTEVDGFVSKLKNNVETLQDVYFNTDSYDSNKKFLAKSFDKIYECFHCHFVTAIHKELYLHNRKMHQKTILLCVMCKSNFYSYSELLCHICPGIYVSDTNINFRCCLCDVDGLPSAFRLLVHLRKRHNACDVCLETTGDQQKLSNHVWKHKLHHLCYRCGIAYRNKPDITKHLFWKHGTESVLCKRCLQKKWPHVYHFCIPPTTFVCEECSAHFSRAVALKVHKRLHAGDLPYSCEECNECFISKKLLAKHNRKHESVSDKENIIENTPISLAEDHQKILDSDRVSLQQDKSIKQGTSTEGIQKTTVQNIANENDNGKSELTGDLCKGTDPEQEGRSDKKSKVVDVYDLPPLNLSSDSDDSDDGNDANKCNTVNMNNEKPESDLEGKVNNETCGSDENLQPQVLDGIWDDFKTYKANLEKKESLTIGDETVKCPLTDILHAVLLDHDYFGCILEPENKTEVPGINAVTENPEQPLPTTADVKDTPDEKTGEDKNRFDAEHNYCFSNDTSPIENEVKESVSAPEESSVIPSKKKQKAVKKKQKRSASSSSSDSSSSDSSSCSCGTNCSCSSSSSSSSGSSSSQSSDSDSSSSEGRRRQAARRERRKERAKSKKKSEATKPDSKVEDQHGTVCDSTPEVQESVIKRSDALEHDENEPTINESDLETDETETDEDFYDKHPQKLANKLLAEKRNQLLLLAAVAPVNNGTIASTSSTAEVSQEVHVTGKKQKTKKRKKQYQQPAAKKVKVDILPKHNTGTSFYSSQVSTFTVSSPLPSASNQTPQVTVPTTAPLPQVPYSPSIPHPSATPSYHSTGSGSETDSKRLSRRRRVPKRFYGDTSDEEGDSTPQRKWQKTSVNESCQPTSSTLSYRSGVNSISEPKRMTVIAPLQEKSDDDDVGEDSESEHEMKRSNSDSSNSDSDKGNEQSDLDSDTDNHSVTHTQTTVKSGEDVQQKSDNLYCYCQCPYDEVSEMIACDGKGCAIEWFHFECVGIMVPPKGEWFCPDCRKKLTSRTEQMLHA